MVSDYLIVLRNINYLRHLSERKVLNTLIIFRDSYNIILISHDYFYSTKREFLRHSREAKQPLDIAIARKIVRLGEASFFNEESCTLPMGRDVSIAAGSVACHFERAILE